MLDSDMKSVSNTEINTFNSCKRQHYYAYDLEVQRKQTSGMPPALYRGTIGHLCLDAFYKILIDGGSNIDARAAAFDVATFEAARIMTETPEDEDRLKLLNKELVPLLQNYFDYYEHDNIRPLYSETTFKARITDEIVYGAILDLVVEFTSGPFRGDLAVFDHKFVYNFYTDTEVEMNSQLPKYIKVLRDNGLDISKGFFNMLRYRTVKDATPDRVFKRVMYKPLKAEVETIWDEQRTAAEQIVNKDYPLLRVLNKEICKWCSYQPLCRSELRGQSIDNMLIADYQKRDRPLKYLENQ